MSSEGICRNMPVGLLPHTPDHKYMITIYELPGSCMIVFMEGVCSLADGRDFAGECSTENIARSCTSASKDFSVTAMGFTIRGEKPMTFKHSLEKVNLAPSRQLTDLYMFLVTKLAMEKYAMQTS